MMLFAFFQWWYGRGWAQQGRSLFSRVEKVADNFSLGILIKTWAAPWKQIITYTGRGSSLDMRFRAKVDNVVSRVVGFLVRTVVILTALLVMSVFAVGGLVILVLWPLVPLLPVVLLAISAGVISW